MKNWTTGVIKKDSELVYGFKQDRERRKKRKLHIEKALEAAHLRSCAMPRQPMRVLKYQNGCVSELLIRCKYFQIEQLPLNTEVQRKLVNFQTASNSFHSLLCVDGCGSISGEGYMLNFFKGDCIFIPAESIPLKLHGQAQILNVSC